MPKEDTSRLQEMLLELAENARKTGIVKDEEGEPSAPNMDPALIDRLRACMGSMAPKLLYRYRSGSDLDLEALEEDKLWASSLKEFNDPFEAKVSVDRQALAERRLRESEELRSVMAAKGIGKDHPLYPGILKELNADAGSLSQWLDAQCGKPLIGCFSEDHASILMWAHYANSHKGICIGYSYEKLLEYYGLNLYPVTYSDRFERTDTFDGVENYEHFLRSFLTKATPWAYEKEWRLIARYNHSGEYLRGELIGAPVPERIYMGVSIPEETEKRLKELCRRKGVALYRMGLSEKRYGLLSYPVTLE